MIVIYRNGERSEITGWRVWLMLAAAGLVLALVGCLAFGLALGLLTLLLLALPIAIGLALFASALQSRK